MAGEQRERLEESVLTHIWEDVPVLLDGRGEVGAAAKGAREPVAITRQAAAQHVAVGLVASVPEGLHAHALGVAQPREHRVTADSQLVVQEWRQRRGRQHRWREDDELHAELLARLEDVGGRGQVGLEVGRRLVGTEECVVAPLASVGGGGG